MAAAIVILATTGATAALAQTVRDHAAGAVVRRVSDVGATRLVYEYQTPGGAARVTVDPSDLLDDLARIRRRGERKPVSQAVIRSAPVVERPQAPTRAAAAEPAAQVGAQATPAGERKVRVIPLYNTSSDDQR
jgi:hypothetical protein